MEFKFATQPLVNCARLASGGTPSKSEPRFWEGDIPWITPKDMGIWDGTTVNRVTKDAIGNGTRLAPAWTSYIAVRGMSLHNEIRVVRPSFPATFNQDIKAVIAKEGTNSKFLYYCLVAHKRTLLEKVESAGHGTGRLPTDQIEKLPIPKVDDHVSSAISKILGDLDDKIDLLRDMTWTLEELLFSLFQSWFVDFLPVRAKAAGAKKFLGVDERTFDMLPTDFKPSEVGEIPTAWDVGSISDVVRLVRNSVKPFNQPEKKYQHFSLPAFDRDQKPDIEQGSTIKSAKFLVPENAILFSKLNPRIPRVWIPGTPLEEYPQIASTEFMVCEILQGWSRAYAYALMSQRAFSEKLSNSATGTSNSHQRVKPDQFAETLIPVPPVYLREQFDERARNLITRMIQNREERQTLTTIRDTLLPKLISGELDIAHLSISGLGEVLNGN